MESITLRGTFWAKTADTIPLARFLVRMADTINAVKACVATASIIQPVTFWEAMGNIMPQDHS
jgi:hypothetical protein